MTDSQANNLTLKLCLQLADNSMILGQRLSEWCGHGPILEQDIAITNIALDLIGEARSYYQYAAEIEGNGKTEDDYPFKRDVFNWQNVLLVELPNEDFAYTIIRQVLFDLYHYHLLDDMSQNCSDERLKSIAAKSVKEAKYHLKYSSEWTIRLGDGTAESHEKMQAALNGRVRYFDEVFIPTKLEKQCIELGLLPDLSIIETKAKALFDEICKRATLEMPQPKPPQLGGKEGRHTEHLGYILSDLQFLQKSYPDSQW